MAVTLTASGATLDSSASISSATAGAIYAPGSIIQTVYTRSDVMTTYSAPASGYVEVGVFTTNITPRYANSKILITFNAFYEFSGHDCGFRLTRNGTEIGRNSADTNQWSHWGIGGYDYDDSTTPRTQTFFYLDSPGTTSLLTYRINAASSSTATNRTLYLNRSISYPNQDAGELGISQLILQEIYMP